MKMPTYWIFLVLFFKCCVSYDLDDVTYDKMPPLFTLDDFDRCLLHGGSYCVVRVDLSAEPGNQLMQQIINYTKSSHIKHYDHTYLEKGVCVTKTCREFIGDKNLTSSEDVHEILETCINKQMNDEYGLRAKVTVSYCEKPGQNPSLQKDTADWVVLWVILSLVLVNLLATVYDVTLSEESKKSLSRGQKMFLCFSLIRNWNHLLSPASTDPKLVKLQGLGGIRVASSFPMVLGHVFWIYTMGFIDNPHDYERAFSLPHFQIIVNGMIIVQPFFVMSGFLLIYNLEKAAENHKVSWKTIPAIYLHRYLRLAPPLSVMLALSATWLRLAGDGPLWGRHVAPVVADCRRYWWTHLLFINNYVQDNKFCAIQTWHIAADTQLFFVGISMYLVTRRRSRNLLLGALMVVAVMLPALHVYFQDLDAMMMKTPEFVRSLDNPNFGSLYVFGHNSMSSFVLGMFTAYKLHEWQTKGVVFKGKIYTYLFRLCLLVFLMTFYTGVFFYEEDYRSPLWMRMLYQGTHRLVITMPVAYVIVGLVMDFDSEYFGRIYSWSGFTFLGRLTYAVYLLHMNFVPVIAGSKRQLEHFSYLRLMVSQLGIVALSYLLAIPFYLMFEAPINPLAKLLLMPPKLSDDSGPPDSQSFLAHVAKKKNKGTSTKEEELKIVQKEELVAEKDMKKAV